MRKQEKTVALRTRREKKKKAAKKKEHEENCDKGEGKKRKERSS